MDIMNDETKDGFTDAERKFRFETGAVWHNGGEVVKRGWYLPYDGHGLPLSHADRLAIERAPFGTFLGASLKKAKETLGKLI